MELKLISCLDKYKEFLYNENIAVGVSGGSDSLGLLFVLQKWAQYNNCNLTAITVDHGLRIESAYEANYVNEICKQINVKHVTLVWDSSKPISNIEFKAREARYNLISEYCKNNSIKYLLTAHHINDQAETFFIRLFRGSGIDGLSSMQDVTNLYEMIIIRPFLKIYKRQIQDYLKENNIKWLEDSSNSDEKFLRNKIRNFINSFENKEEIITRINFAIEEINKSRVLINDFIEEIEKNYVKFDNFGSCIFDRKLLTEKEEIVLKILAKISMKISSNIYKPRLEKLKRLFYVLKNSDKIRYTFYGCIFEWYNKNLFIVYREYSALDNDIELIYNSYVIWDNRFRIKLNKDIKNVFVTHVKDGEFNGILKYMIKNNYKKYKEMKEIKNIEKKIFYTLPVICIDNKYIFDCKFVDIEFINK